MVIAATAGFAAKGVFAKLAYAQAMTVTSLVLLRFAMAVPLFWAGVSLFRQQKQGACTQITAWKGCVIGGVLFFVATLCDFTAVSLIDVGISRVILFTFPVWVIFINAVRDRTLPPGRALICFTAAYFGVCLLVLPDGLNDLSQLNGAGVAWSLASAVTYAVYLVNAQETMKSIGSIHYTALSNTVTMVCAVIYFAVTAEAQDWVWQPAGIGWVAVLALISTVIPFFLLLEGVKRIGASQASLLTLFGPGVTLGLAFLILGETLSPGQGAGFVLVILAIGMIRPGNVIEAGVRKWVTGGRSV